MGVHRTSSLRPNTSYGGFVKTWNCTWSKFQRFHHTAASNSQLAAAPAHSQQPTTMLAAGALEIKLDRRLCVEAYTHDQSVRLVPCSPAARGQQWQFVMHGGKHRLFGGLRNVGTGQCLTRSKVDSLGDEYAVTVPCSADPVVQRRHCDQSWYLPKAAQHFEADAAAETTMGSSARAINTDATAAMTNAPKLPPRPASSRAEAELQRKGKILCWVLTHPDAHTTKAAAVNRTWGSRCDYLLFVTSKHSPGLPTFAVDLTGPESRASDSPPSNQPLRCFFLFFFWVNSRTLMGCTDPP